MGWPDLLVGSTTAADLAASKEAILISNVVRPQRYIQAGTVLYYNVKKPWSGTTNAAVDLTDAGTIAKLTGQKDNTTLQTLASVFAPNGIVGTAAALAPYGYATGKPKPKKPPQATPGPYHLQLGIVERGYEYTFSAVANKSAVPPCVAESGHVGETGGESTYNTTVKELPSQPPAASPKSAGKAPPPKPGSPSS